MYYQTAYLTFSEMPFVAQEGSYIFHSKEFITAIFAYRPSIE
jgi:hypothetical protein